MSTTLEEYFSYDEELIRDHEERMSATLEEAHRNGTHVIVQDGDRDSFAWCCDSVITYVGNVLPGVWRRRPELLSDTGRSNMADFTVPCTGCGGVMENGAWRISPDRETGTIRRYCRACSE